MTAAPTYIYGFDDRELHRLGQQHRAWADECAAHWSRAGFSVGQTLLDLGCGPGFASRDLAQLVGPHGKIIAVDSSERSLRLLRETPAPLAGAAIESHLCAAEELDLEAGSVDGIYARWVFTFIADPLSALRRLARALRPGGRLAIMDYLDWQTVSWGPERDTLDLVRKAVARSFAAHRVNGLVGHVLPVALLQAGLEVLEMRPIVRIARPGEARHTWYAQWAENYFPSLVSDGHLDGHALEAWRAEWQRNSGHRAGFFVAPIQVALVARLPG